MSELTYEDIKAGKRFKVSGSQKEYEYCIVGYHDHQILIQHDPFIKTQQALNCKLTKQTITIYTGEFEHRYYLWALIPV